MQAAAFLHHVWTGLVDPLALIGYAAATLVGRSSWRKATVLCCIWGAVVEFTYLALFRADRMAYAGPGLLPRLVGACIAAAVFYALWRAWRTRRAKGGN